MLRLGFILDVLEQLECWKILKRRKTKSKECCCIILGDKISLENLYKMQKPYS